MIHYAEEVAICLSQAKIAKHIVFKTETTASVRDGAACQLFGMQFDGKRRGGIQALYTDGTNRVQIGLPTPGIMMYEVLDDATFVAIGRYRRGKWVLEELIFTNRDQINIDELVVVLRGLYDHSEIKHKKFEAALTKIRQL